MRDLFFSQKTTKFSAAFLLATALAVLAGCSAGTTTATGTSGTGGTGGTGGTTAGTPSMTIALVSNSISNGATTIVNATVKDGTGAAVPYAVVTFSTDQNMATMTPSNGTALTDGSGLASITLTAGANQGATTITATAQVGTTAVTGSTGYTVGGAAVTISPPVFGVGASSLSAFGTTSVTVTINGTSSQTINFSSICSGSNPAKAALSTGIATVAVAGVQTAVGSYRDNGCASTDTITASISGGLSTSTGTLTVIPPTAGSIQYVSSLPANISLKGTGGTEVSQVTFKVLDTGGNPLSGKTVTFGLSTTTGGITLTPNTGVAPFDIGSATSDANGLVVTNVNAGTQSTPVRVTATACTTVTKPCTGTILTTQSSQLTITTGIPDQFGFSLSGTKLNVEGLSHDGETSIVTARLADHFKNPVPDGTGVVFTAEAGSIVGSCTTVAGGCSVVYTTQGTRPTDGRVTLLATALGEETFTDLNGNGLADLSPNEMIDPNGNPTDLPEAFVDYNENGTRDPNEPFVDFNQDGIYNPPDGKFNGVLCNEAAASFPSSAGTCSSHKTLDVRSSLVIVLSGSDAVTTITPAASPLDLGGCGGAQKVSIDVRDVNGNVMPVGTTIEVKTSNGILSGATSFIVGNTNKKPPVNEYSVLISGDGTMAGTPPVCTDPHPLGILDVTVITPLQTKTITGIPVTN